MTETIGPRRSRALALSLLILGGAGAASVAAETAASSEAAAKPLTVEQAVAAGLAADPGVLSAALDAQSARARAADARDRMLPSLAVSAGYSQLSNEPTFSFGDLPTSALQALAPYAQTLNALAPVFADLLPNIDQAGDVRVDLQYPIFAGFRIREAAEIAKLQALGKEAAAELTRRALTFEIRRAYWEALRATANVETLRKALELESVVRDEVEGLSAQGMATDAEKLAEDARLDQAKLALDDAQAGKELAFLVLSTLVGDASASSVAAIEYSLGSVPGSSQPPGGLADSDLADSRLGELVDKALANRPETRAASVALKASLAAGIASKADLYPSLSVIGSISYADPDPRLFPVQNLYNLSWSIGARVRYDVGAIPGALERSKAAQADAEKAKADLDRQRNAIVLDLRKCVLALRRARNSLTLTRAMVGQAEEARRAAEAKYENGLARRSEVLQAEMTLLRANLAVESKLIDVEIAQADLVRAGALE